MIAFARRALSSNGRRALKNDVNTFDVDRDEEILYVFREKNYENREGIEIVFIRGSSICRRI